MECWMATYLARQMALDSVQLLVKRLAYIFGTHLALQMVESMVQKMATNLVYQMDSVMADPMVTVLDQSTVP
eukprot:scaffold6785_cov174-Chaetoceros_neogracile.AAC.1